MGTRRKIVVRMCMHLFLMQLGSEWEFDEFWFSLLFGASSFFIARLEQREMPSWDSPRVCHNHILASGRRVLLRAHLCCAFSDCKDWNVSDVSRFWVAEDFAILFELIVASAKTGHSNMQSDFRFFWWHRTCEFFKQRNCKQKRKSSWSDALRSWWGSFRARFLGTSSKNVSNVSISNRLSPNSAFNTNASKTLLSTLAFGKLQRVW